MKVDIETIQNLNNPVSAVERINGNFTRVQEAIEATLSRDGTLPNHMQDVLDMNYNRIINLPAPVGPSDPVRMQDIITNAQIEEIYRLILLAQEATEDAADRGEVALEDLLGRYLGAYPDNASAEASAPGVIEPGTLYYNLTVETFRYWDGDSWETIPYATVADGAITTQKLDDGAVTWSKMDPAVQPWVSPEDFGYQAGITVSQARQIVQDTIDYASQYGKTVLLRRVYDVADGLALLYHPNTHIKGTHTATTGFHFEGGIPLFRKDPSYDTGWIPGVILENFSITGDGTAASVGVWLQNTLFAKVRGLLVHNVDYGIVDAGEDGASKNLGSRISENTLNISGSMGIQLGGVGDEPPHTRHAIIENNRVAPFVGGTIESGLRAGFAEFATIQNNRFEDYTLAGVDTGECRGFVIQDNYFGTSSAITDIYVGDGAAEWDIRNNFYSNNAMRVYLDTDPDTVKLSGFFNAETALPTPLVLEDYQHVHFSIAQTVFGLGGTSAGDIYALVSTDWNSSVDPILVTFTGNADGRLHFVIENISGGTIDLGGLRVNILVRGTAG